MAARNKLICAVLLAVLAWGLYDILTNYEQNGCAMTYMYQMPEYLVSKIKLLSSIGNTMSKLTSLQLINIKTVDKLPNSAPCFLSWTELDPHVLKLKIRKLDFNLLCLIWFVIWNGMNQLGGRDREEISNIW